MFKTFVFGIILGIAAGCAALYFVPVVNQVRENSMMTVTRNGGNSEIFHANVPDDRILIGAPRQRSPLPAELKWPVDSRLAGVRTELFKIRNANSAVVGVASRIAGSVEGRDVVEWMLHLPARGSAYLTMQPLAVDAVYRIGDLRAGTDEFAGLQGQVTERWVANSSADEDAPSGKIELTTIFVAVEHSQ